MAAKNSWECVSKLRIFLGGIISRMVTRIHFHSISDYPTDVLTPLVDWLPAQLLGWLAI